MRRAWLAFLMTAILWTSAQSWAASFEVVLVTAPTAENSSAGRSFAGIVTDPKRPVRHAVTLALHESSQSLATLNVTTVLNTLVLRSDQDLGPQLSDVGANQLVILDLPLAMFEETARVLSGRGAILVNVRHRDAALREILCQADLYHTIPSERMYFDALGQFLIYRGWRRVLVVHGPTTEDIARTDALTQSLEKFGANITDIRPFTLSHHPDDRDQNNPEFLTGGASYDVVAVIDSARDFGRSLQFSTRQPRPVVGDVGLRPRAWHGALERYGAPQLNARFQAEIGEGGLSSMTDEEFSAWAAIKFVTNTLQPSHIENSAIQLKRVFSDPEGRVDLYKGTRGSFRRWNHQLRQPMLLATEDAVIAVSPLPKFLHPTHYTDTLGLDQPESRCQLQ